MDWKSAKNSKVGMVLGTEFGSDYSNRPFHIFTRGIHLKAISNDYRNTSVVNQGSIARNITFDGNQDKLFAHFQGKNDKK